MARLDRLTKMSKVVHEAMQDPHTSEKVGYLTRAVEDLTFKLERHMEKEEEDRQRDRQDFSEYRSKIDSKVAGVTEDVKEIKEDVGGLRKSMVAVVVATGVAGAILEKIDSATLEALLGIVVKLFG